MLTLTSAASARFSADGQARDDALAGAVLTEHEHVRVGRRDPVDLRQLLHRARPGDEFFVAVFAQQAILRAQALLAPHRRAERDLVAQHADQARVVPGFSMKSPAPRRIASTARCIDPHAVITRPAIRVGALERLEQFRPSAPDVVSRV
jgi:hypothetical protein